MINEEFIDSLTNPRYDQAKNILFDAIWSGKSITFLATPNDVEKHGREIYEAALSGKFGKIAEYVPISSEEPKNSQIPYFPLVETVQDLKSRIETLEAIIEELKRKI